MRIQLNLSVTGVNRVIPVNYQYELSAWIYKTLYYGDPAFASWLHDKGYAAGKRSFKLFTFSNIKAERYKVFKDRFKILSDEVSLVVTFRIDEAVRHFITGLFSHQAVSIGDRKSRADFEVRTVENLALPDFEETMRFRALSPLCVSLPVELKGSLIAQYLGPDHPEYRRRFFENLVTRYNSRHSESPEGLESYSPNEHRLVLLGKPKSRLIKIKADTPQETRIRGYLYDFECTAPVELLQFGYEAGFGEKNSLGFGCVEADLKRTDNDGNTRRDRNTRKVSENLAGIPIAGANPERGVRHG